MRQGAIECILVNQEGHRLSERVVNGILYTVAVPGEEYMVRVTVHDSGSFPHKGYLKLLLLIDGQTVGYCGLIGPLKDEFEPTSFVFNGYVHSSSVSFTTSAATSGFLFRETEWLDPGTRPSTTSTGVIQLSVYHGYRLSTLPAEDFRPRCTDKILSENKKWWKQPSASTMVGSNLGRKEISSTSMSAPNSQLVQRMVLHYHTDMVLDLQQNQVLSRAATVEIHNKDGKNRSGEDENKAVSRRKGTTSKEPIVID